MFKNLKKLLNNNFFTLFEMNYWFPYDLNHDKDRRLTVPVFPILLEFCNTVCSVKKIVKVIDIF